MQIDFFELLDKDAKLTRRLIISWIFIYKKNLTLVYK